MSRGRGTCSDQSNETYLLFKTIASCASFFVLGTVVNFASSSGLFVVLDACLLLVRFAVKISLL